MYKIFFILSLFFSSAFSMTAITVTYPIEEFFVKKIAGKQVYIKTISENYNTLDMSENSLKKFSNSQYYFNFNLDEEKRISNILQKDNSSIHVINMNKGVTSLKLDNGEINPYTWLDPILARDLAKNIYETIIKIRPYDKDIFIINYKNFLEELDETYLDIKSRIDRSDLYGFFSFNNQLDYFSKRFRINNYHKECKILNINEVSNLIDFVKKEHIKHIVIPTDADYTFASSFKGYIGGKIVEYDMYSINWKVNLYTILRGIENF